MNDEESAASSRDGEMMLYDHYKHITSLCLFSLAGGVALADKAQGRWAVMLIIALLLIGTAALVSFTVSGQIVEARLGGRPSNQHRSITGKLPGLLLSVGIGILLYIFTRSLKL
jgi:hypothetical protein